MGFVLAVEPDRTQADILRRALGQHAGIKLVVVTSAYAANVSMNRQIPDVVLLGDSLKLKQQQEVTARFRSLSDVPNAPTISIPAPLANTERFVELLVVTLNRVEQEQRAKVERAVLSRQAPASAPEPIAELTTSAESGSDAIEIDAVEIDPAESPMFVDLAKPSGNAPGSEVLDDHSAALLTDTVSEQLQTIEIEALGSDLDESDADAEQEEEEGEEILIDFDEAGAAQPGIDPEVHFAELAIVQAQAEQRLFAELERVRDEAAQQRTTELAKVQEEAEARRRTEVEGARGGGAGAAGGARARPHRSRAATRRARSGVGSAAVGVRR